MIARLFDENNPEKQAIKVAIVGGGALCKFFLELINSGQFPYLEINLVGVCDIDPSAEGLKMAREMGIFTTDNFRDLFLIKNLNYLVELTNNKTIFNELVNLRPPGVSVLDHNIGRLLQPLLTFSQRARSAEHQMILQKMSSDFIIQHSDAAIVILNTDFSIVDANEAYLKKVNRSRDEVIGGYCYEVSHRLNAPCSVANPVLKCPMIETLKTGKSAHVIHELKDSGNRENYENIVTYPLKDQNEKVFKIIEIWRDITREIASRWEKRAAELKANLNIIVQEDRMISLGKLAASCVHEINNPIQGLLTFTHLMQHILNEGNPDQKDLKILQLHLALMSNELERCGRIISGLLSFSRTTNHGYKDVDLNEILKEIITLIRHKSELQNIILKADLCPHPLIIRGDMNQLQQCFLNLAFNGMEAMPNGGQLDIISELDSEQEKVCVEVRDTGTGIKPEDIQHVFDPFFTTKGEGEGTGLGLSIVYGIVKNHRGHISINNRKEGGCSFVVTFPVK
jgi:signal transduction histidine kinase